MAMPLLVPQVQRKKDLEAKERKIRRALIEREVLVTCAHPFVCSLYTAFQVRLCDPRFIGSGVGALRGGGVGLIDPPGLGLVMRTTRARRNQ